MTDGSYFDGKRVLAADGSRAVRLYLRDVLARRGAAVAEAGTGAEALALCDGGARFDLVLLDLDLPDLDGIEVLARIRAAEPDVPVVMITGAGGLQSATEAVRRGADGSVDEQRLAAGGDEARLLDALRQAAEHRAGIAAQRQLEETKADFYSRVTHDLRNPAGALAAIVDLLLAGKAGALTMKQEQLLNVARASAAKLTGLIDDYLDYASIDAGYLRLERREVDLRMVAEAAAYLMGPQAGLKQLTIRLDLPREAVRASADPERLGQVLDNLLSNAVKYTPEGGWITLSLAAEEGAAVFRVKDTGMGIPPEQLPRLFTPFTRVPGEATRAIRGTGLGLLIVKEIAEAHGGSVRVESEGVAGRGSTFTVRVPIAPPEGAGEG